MIEWKMVRVSFDETYHHNLLSSSALEVKESDKIEFQVRISNAFLEKVGPPLLVVGDIPIELEFFTHDGENRIYNTAYLSDSNKSKLFYNFFGESSLVLYFENNEEYVFEKKVNILARRENAVLANKMLSFITEHIDDAVQVCFSRSKIGASLTEEHAFSFVKVELIKTTTEHLARSFTAFKREHKFKWESQLELTENGQPTGPDSVAWALTNLDRLSPSIIDEANLVFNNRGYNFPELPNEVLKRNTDVFENSVINAFLFSSEGFLNKIGRELHSTIGKTSLDSYDSEYVRFDHTMSKYMDIIVKHKYHEILLLSKKIRQLRFLYNRVMPSKSSGNIIPKMTSYVAKHKHYQIAFELIDKCNRAPAPSLQGNQLLLGLKNLAIIYETATLLLIHKSIERVFSAQISEQSFRLHGDSYPFGGIEKERPIGRINNYFKFSSDMYVFDLFYEPKIYPLSENSSVGDLIDTSNTRAHPVYGSHHFCPDFVIRVSASHWQKPLIIILDAKFKDANTIKKFDMDELTRKYLLNIHQLREDGVLGVSPVQLMLAIFAHAKTGKRVHTVSRQHTVDGSRPVLPQSAAVHLDPEQTSLFEQQLKGAVSIIEGENRLTLKQ